MPIIQSISRFLQTVQIPFTTVSNRNRQKKFFRKNIFPQQETAKKTNDESLDENELKKITGYGLMVPATLGEAFCALRGKPMMDKERLAVSSMAAMSGLTDAFFNRHALSEQGLKELSENPERFSANTADEKLFLDLYKTALANAVQPAEMQKQFYKMCYVLLLSKQQDGQGLSYEIIKDITMRKGAELLLFYRTAFGHPFKKGEEKMLSGMGGLIQLSNDIFDVYMDRQNGTSTLVTTATKIEALRFHYSALLQIVTEAAFRSGYPKKNIRKCLGLINVGIFNGCYVCLDQLGNVEKRSGNVFDLNACRKKDLVCDIDSVPNKLKSLWYYFKLARKSR